MDNQDLRTLKILKEADNGQLPSQRDLARKLNVSLGLVNSFVKRLAHKGYFKITTIPRNRVSYLLTPKGAAEKTRLTYEYIQYSFHFYKAARKKLQKIFETLENENVQNIVFYGVSDLTEIAYISLQETSLRLVAVVDDFKIGEKFLRFRVTDPDQISGFAFAKVVITVMERRDAILESLRDIGIPKDKIIMFDEI